MFNERLTKLTAWTFKNPRNSSFRTVFRTVCGILCLLSFNCNSFGQNGFSIEPSFHFGAVTKHTSKLTFQVKGPTFGADVNFKFQTFGKKEWQEWRKFPWLGVTATWLRFGNEPVLGQAFAIAPNVTIPLFEKKRWKGHFQVGTGIAYMTRKYHVNDNPNNNAIGAHRVSTMLLKFYIDRQINEKWKFNIGMSLNHFSNGGSRLPNFGLNIPALMIGVNYAPQPLEVEDFIFHKKNRTRIRKFGLDVHAGLGLVQRFVIGGPRYPVYVYSLGGNYYLNRVNRLIVGFEYEQNKAIYNFALHTYHSTTREDAWKKASRVTLFAGDEFLFGSWSIILQAGVYLGRFSFLKSGNFYTKFSTRFYFPSKRFFKQKFFLNVSLKTHLSVAEYISVGGGINF